MLFQALLSDNWSELEKKYNEFAIFTVTIVSVGWLVRSPRYRFNSYHTNVNLSVNPQLFRCMKRTSFRYIRQTYEPGFYVLHMFTQENYDYAITYIFNSIIKQ